VPDPTASPIADPTNNPVAAATNAPTVACNQEPALRDLLIRILVNTVSDSNVVGTSGTPQNQAVRWLIDQDTRYLCPDSPALLSRYSLAVFYYSTRGDRWLECSAPSSFNDTAAIEAANAACNIQAFPDSGSDAWLTPGDECQWGGVVCNGNGDVEIINIGTLLLLLLLKCISLMIIASSTRLEHLHVFFLFMWMFLLYPFQNEMDCPEL
jgi:hypothetical protein